MITTKKELFERLKSYKPNEKLLVLFWGKDEFDGDLDGRELTTKEWDTILSEVYEDGANEEISEQITSAVADIAAEEEDESA
jgi:hypothetical protein